MVVVCRAPWEQRVDPADVAECEQRAKAEADRKARADKEAEAAAAAQAEMKRLREAQAKAERDRQAKVAAAAAEDEKLGYKRMSITDFLLDWRTMERGERVAIAGLHFSVGQLETLANDAMSTQVIYVDTTGLPRDLRKKILECHAHSTWCRVTVRAHTGCTLMVGSNSTAAPCLVVDDIR